jgi:hypothetical protein
LLRSQNKAPPYPSDSAPAALIRRRRAPWQEVGGPAVETPTKKGFGTRLVSSSLSAFGEVSLDYAPTGLILRLDAPLQKLQYKNYSDAEE